MKAGRDILVAFDLDDTLYKERDYVLSGYRYVARTLARRLHIPFESVEDIMIGCDDDRHPFDRLYDFIDGGVTVESMVEMYRNHFPSLVLPEESRRCLDRLKVSGVTLALITDGRHNGQWNKIKALGLERYFSPGMISVSADVGADKTHVEPWIRMEHLTSGCKTRWYIGDNPRKDFYYPRRLGWHTVMLADDGSNIKRQDIPLPGDHRAEFTIKSLDSLPGIILDM